MMAVIAQATEFMVVISLECYRLTDASGLWRVITKVKYWDINIEPFLQANTTMN